MVCESCVAGITVYNPDIMRLRNNIAAISGQVAKVLVVDNASNNTEEIKKITEDYKNVIFFRNDENEGIAYSMNQIGKYAVDNNYRWFMTLDQDSVVPRHMVEDFLIHDAEDIAIICPNITFNHSFIKQLLGIDKEEEDHIPVKIVKKAVSSGQLIKTSAFKKTGGFWEYLFIDYVDQEICFNVRKLGYRIIEVCSVHMDHEPGINVKVFGITTAKQNAVREYYCARNSRLVYWLYKKEFKEAIPHAPVILTFKRICNCILIREDVRNKIKSICKGIVDAYRWKHEYSLKGRIPVNNGYEVGDET